MTSQTREQVFKDASSSLAPPSFAKASGATHFPWCAQRSYSAEVPALALDEQSRLIDWLIDLAFDTLGACHLDVRVLAAAPDHAPYQSTPGCPVHTIAIVNV